MCGCLNNTFIYKHKPQAIICQALLLEVTTEGILSS